jgi:trigger factor
MEMLIQQAARQYREEDRERFIQYIRSDALAAAQLRAPLYEDKVVDFLFDKAEVSEREVTKDELQAAIEAEESAPPPAAKPKKASAKKAPAKDASSKDASSKDASAPGKPAEKPAPAKPAKKPETKASAGAKVEPPPTAKASKPAAAGKPAKKAIAKK